MDFRRSQYMPLSGGENSKWSHLAVVATAAALGAVVGLGLSAVGTTSAYSTSSMTASASATQVPVLQWSASAPIVPLAASDADFLDNSNVDFSTEVPVNTASVSSWMSLSLFPLAAAAAGFLLGSRRPMKETEPGVVEVVIDDSVEDIAMAATTGLNTSLYAVVEIGGHQYIVQPGQILSVNKLPLSTGDEFAFEKVLLLKNGENAEFGHPYLSGAKVTAEVLRNSKGRKIRIFKYRAKKHYRVTKGHRQKYTDIHITEVAGTRVPSKVDFSKVAATV